MNLASAVLKLQFSVSQLVMELDSAPAHELHCRYEFKGYSTWKDKPLIQAYCTVVLCALDCAAKESVQNLYTVINLIRKSTLELTS